MITFLVYDFCNKDWTCGIVNAVIILSAAQFRDVSNSCPRIPAARGT